MAADRAPLPKTEVLIIGAGPTGLVLALGLNRSGLRARIVDQAPGPGQASRALVVQARTLELYRQLGLAAPMVEMGLPFAALNLWVLGKRAARVELGPMGEGLSPFPYLLICPQDQHERVLNERLAAAGLEVEWSTELVGLEPGRDEVVARLRRRDGSVELCAAAYLAGCDGARSFVREALDVRYPGGTYSHLFYVADVEATGPTINGELHVALDEADLLACFPLRGPARARLVGTVRKEAETSGEKLDFGAVNQRVIQQLRLDVRHIRWFSTYHVHHRVASTFRAGRTFLLGDAAHVHSPVGGQGMNTGIGDAINLAWKLGMTVRGQADAGLLDTYPEERLPFAQRLVQTTDRVFEFVSAEGPLAPRVRTRVMPRLLVGLFRSATVRRFLFQTVSQVKLNYRHSTLAEGRVAGVHGGDRLPWVAYQDGTDNYESLCSPGWHVHVYGSAATALAIACGGRKLALDVFPWTRGAQAAGLVRDAVYLVRPDGYVALATAASGMEQALGQYFERRGLCP